MEQHICSKCKGSGPFNKNKSRKSGLTDWCRVCMHEHRTTKAYRDRHNELRRSNHVSDPRKQMLLNARGRARRYKVPFNISIEDIIIPSVCPVLGIPIFVAKGKEKLDNSPTLDRRIPYEGYVKGNVSVISYRANRIKNDATPQEMLSVALHFQERPPYIPDFSNFERGVTPVLYSGPFWDKKEVNAAVKALLKGKWITAGEYVARFQNEFSRKFNVKYSHMVNSGSSANLVMIAALKTHLKWKDGDEIIVSPVGFPTTIAPIVQNGLRPVFVDIEMETLNFDLIKVKGAITSRTKAIFVSPVLGNPPDMDELKSFRITLIGDNCDSLGSKWSNNLLNEYYYAWSSSFYPAHHASTGEGGMVSSNDAELIKTARSVAWWGRDCYCVGQANLLSCGTCGKRFSKWLDDTDAVVDHKYVFTNMGYNLKPLDLQGAIGLAQLEKFEEIDSKRRSNFLRISGFFRNTPRVRVASYLLQADPCWFGVPVICEDAEEKRKLVEYLEANNIQTRSYFAGNILMHPGYKHLGTARDFPNACQVLDKVFFLGCPPQYSPEILDYIGEVISKWDR